MADRPIKRLVVAGKRLALLSGTFRSTAGWRSDWQIQAIIRGVMTLPLEEHEIEVETGGEILVGRGVLVNASYVSTTGRTLVEIAQSTGEPLTVKV